MKNDFKTSDPYTIVYYSKM